MRLWHYELIPYLPKSQLLAQWRELNSIFKKQDNHILINYVYKYTDYFILNYTLMIIKEMNNRNFKIRSFQNCYNYFKDFLYKDQLEIFTWDYIPNEYIDGWLEYDDKVFPEHNDRYLIQCFYNLQEKYDRGQKDFSKEQYDKLESFIKEAL